MNQREAAKENNGIYATLIGDMRKSGAFHSFQADFIKFMPREELKSVVIKQQVNTFSGRKPYGNLKHPTIDHEYLIIWQRTPKSIFQISWDKGIELKKEITMTWRTLIRMVMMKLGEAKLSDIYAEVERVGGDLLNNNNHIKAKCRQILQKHHTSVSRGVWAL